MEEFYFKKVNNKFDKSKVDKIKLIFSQNEITVGIANIIHHLNTSKGEIMEKLINILVKINYLNFQNWKTILEEYLLHLSIYSDTNYLFYTSKEITQILVHLKQLEENVLNFMEYPYNYSDMKNTIEPGEILQLIRKAVDKSSDCFLKDLEYKNVDYISLSTYSVIMGKYKLIDEKISRRLEKSFIPFLDLITDIEFAKLFFNIFKNKYCSENFFVLLEKKAENFITDYLSEKKPVNTYFMTLIAKGRKNLINYYFYIFFIFS